MVARAVTGFFKGPRYFSEIVAQMDVIGVGSLSIILLTGFFTGGVLTVQTFPTLAFWGQQGQTGRLVAVSLVRELGPVLTALMVTGRVGSAIAAELGSMTVSQQIDAMRALGTDPIRKLVAPRTIALLVALPLLTVLADVVGIGGGAFAATSLYGLSISEFLTSVRDGISTDDIIGGRHKADLLCSDHRFDCVLQRPEYRWWHCWRRKGNNASSGNCFDCRHHCRLLPCQSATILTRNVI